MKTKAPYQQFLLEKRNRDRVDALALSYLVEKDKEGKEFVGSYSALQGDTHLLNLEPKITLPNQYTITRIEIHLDEVRVTVYTNSGDLIPMSVTIEVAEMLGSLSMLFSHIYMLCQNLEF